MFPSPFQSTHPLRGATSGQLIKIAALHISIHAPLAGCDAGQRDAGLAHAISIHAPLAGCDLVKSISRFARNTFQSTHPLRGATTQTVVVAGRAQISIHAPLAGCDLLYTSVFGKHVISIHAPLTGCDLVKSISRFARNTFQSTHPSRGATAKIHKFLCVLL